MAGTSKQSRRNVDRLSRGYPVATSKGTRVARPSVGEDERYRLTMGQQPRGLSQYDSNVKRSQFNARRPSVPKGKA